PAGSSSSSSTLSGWGAAPSAPPADPWTPPAQPAAAAPPAPGVRRKRRRVVLLAVAAAVVVAAAIGVPFAVDRAGKGDGGFDQALLRADDILLPSFNQLVSTTGNRFPSGGTYDAERRAVDSSTNCADAASGPALALLTTHGCGQQLRAVYRDPRNDDYVINVGVFNLRTATGAVEAQRRMASLAGGLLRLPPGVVGDQNSLSTSVMTSGDRSHYWVYVLITATDPARTLQAHEDLPAAYRDALCELVLARLATFGDD
ncbi:hypothetical protein ABZS66_23680, partial [Dactylosporangium sp. NPDC005572]|uniref:hypothetical protein n=1 Tax=Dactylosporangium sp. NPDC005572 TaxID=3156889 RepID=UPI0033A79EBD